MKLNFGLLALLAAFIAFPSLAHAQEGMVQIQSQYSVPITTERLIVAAKARGLNVIGRVNHAEGAKNAGMSLRPTELVIFGNPKVGTPMMVCSQTVGIDLPQKALIWEDAKGEVWLGYNNPTYVAERHRIEDCGMSVKKVEKALLSLAKLATQPSPQ
ncbi:hypothetical protein A1OO_11275 [Enterovibrio norvegicus FF-33]|uniref:DUF302 domain-containing protein n=1 Tax=Enterovibrio norvegicus TaxID=188144 RepID=UPI00031A295E|nr:DUF302 domain-containing protein [Enterovibrio norvegicus]OEE66358.1 hypothetical protein A1OO_11275 [Enterovibrio norvegicus FF-33]